MATGCLSIHSHVSVEWLDWRRGEIVMLLLLLASLSRIAHSGHVRILAVGSFR